MILNFCKSSIIFNNVNQLAKIYICSLATIISFERKYIIKYIRPNTE